MLRVLINSRFCRPSRVTWPGQQNCSQNHYNWDYFEANVQNLKPTLRPINRHIVLKFCGKWTIVVLSCSADTIRPTVKWVFLRFKFMPDFWCTNLGTTSPYNLMCVSLYRVEPPLIRVNYAKNATVDILITCVARPSAWSCPCKICNFLASMEDPWFQLLVQLCRYVIRCKYDTLAVCCSGIRLFSPILERLLLITLLVVVSTLLTICVQYHLLPCVL